jgi:hypothetical protein
MWRLTGEDFDVKFMLDRVARPPRFLYLGLLSSCRWRLVVAAKRFYPS